MPSTPYGSMALRSIPQLGPEGCVAALAAQRIAGATRREPTTCVSRKWQTFRHAARGAVEILVSAAIATLAACGSASAPSSGSSQSAQAYSCARVAAILKIGADRRLVSQRTVPTTVIVADLRHIGQTAAASDWARRPSNERVTACTFGYPTPHNIPASGAPTPCPGGYYAQPPGVTDFGTVAAVMDAKGNVTRLPVPSTVSDGPAC